MKKALLLIASLATASAAQAQITQEKQYARTVEAFRLSTGEVRYATYVPGASNQVRIYNQSHALVQQTTVPLPATTYAQVDYVSDKLFNTNAADLEFLLYISSSARDYAQVFSSAGASLLRVDSTNYVSIFNSPAGTKLITYQSKPLSDYYSRVYALPGTQATLAVRAAEAATDQALPYPNPATERVQLPYTVPAGQVGTLTVTDLAGRQVQRVQVDATFDHLLLDTRALRPGVYFYQVQVGSSASAAKRFVVR